MKFSPLNVHFSSPSLDPQNSRRPASNRATPFKSANFTVICLSIVKTVADKHRYNAYRSKHWWRAFKSMVLTSLDDIKPSN